VACTGRSDTGSRPAHLPATFARVDVDPAVSCRSDGLHVAQSARLWIVTNRLIDVLRYYELSSEPQAQRWLGWRSEDLASARTSMVAGPIWAPQPMIPHDVPLLLFAGVERVTNVMVGAIAIDRSAGRADVAGVVDRDHRGQGPGSELGMTFPPQRSIGANRGVSQFARSATAPSSAANRSLPGVTASTSSRCAVVPMPVHQCPTIAGSGLHPPSR
jgi:hypothetical protein